MDKLTEQPHSDNIRPEAADIPALRAQRRMSIYFEFDFNRSRTARPRIMKRQQIPDRVLF